MSLLTSVRCQTSLQSVVEWTLGDIDAGLELKVDWMAKRLMG